MTGDIKHGDLIGSNYRQARIAAENAHLKAERDELRRDIEDAGRGFEALSRRLVGVVADNGRMRLALRALLDKHGDECGVCVNAEQAIPAHNTAARTGGGDMNEVEHSNYSHVTTDAGNLRSRWPGDYRRLPETFVNLIENVGNVYEMAEEMFGMIWFLADQAHGDEPTPAQLRETIEGARQNYKAGLRIAREAM